MRGVGEAAKTILKARSEEHDLPLPKINESVRDLPQDKTTQSGHTKFLEPPLILPVDNEQDAVLKADHPGTIHPDAQDNISSRDLSNHPKQENLMSLTITSHHLVNTHPQSDSEMQKNHSSQCHSPEINPVESTKLPDRENGESQT
jgi:hypothetical protein